MSQQRFAAALERVARDGRARKGIGTLSEKTLHAVLKQYMDPYEGNHETKIGPYVADIVGEDGIIEIQTRGFHRLRDKLAAFLAVATVTVVYPIAAVKWLVWLDPDTGETTKKRRSPRRGTPYDAFYELYRIKQLLPHPNLRLRLVLLEMEEYRQLNGWSHDRKRGSSRYELIPTAFVGEVAVNGPEEYIKLIPPGLPERFTSREFSAASAMPQGGARTALNVLLSVGAVRRIGKRGRLYEYEVNTCMERNLEHAEYPVEDKIV